MAVLETIKSFFVPAESAAAEKIIPAPPTNYEIKPLILRLSASPRNTGVVVSLTG